MVRKECYRFVGSHWFPQVVIFLKFHHTMPFDLQSFCGYLQMFGWFSYKMWLNLMIVHQSINAFNTSCCQPLEIPFSDNLRLGDIFEDFVLGQCWASLIYNKLITLN